MTVEDDLWRPFDVTDETIASIAKEHKIFVVDCWAEWCAPCRTMSKYLEKLSREYKGDVVFAKLDTEANRASVKRYGITTVPTLLLFYNGEFSDIILGAMDMDYIKSVIEDLRERKARGED